MANISIDTNKSRSVLSGEDDLAQLLNTLYMEVDRVRGALRYKISVQETITDRLHTVAEQIEHERIAVKSLRTGLATVVVRYDQAENSNVSLLKADKPTPSIRSTLPVFTLPDWLFDGQYPSITFSLLTSLVGWLSENNVDILSPLKSILKAIDSGAGIKGAGIAKDVISYIEDLVAFYTGDKKGLTGASDFCDLTDSSVGVWKGLYDFFSDKYDQKTGFFGEAAQKNVGCLGLSAGFIGLLGSLLSASNGLESKNWPTAVADYVDSGSDIITILKSAYKLDHIGDASSLAKSKAGLWSALNIYAALGDSGVRAVAQGFRSYEEYSADGVWDLGDTGATGIDISIAGLYGISHTLTFGLDDLIFGAVDRATGGDGNGNYIEKAAEGWKIIGTTIGEAIGNWWNGLFR